MAKRTVRFNKDQQLIQVRDLAWVHLLTNHFNLMFPSIIPNQWQSHRVEPPQLRTLKHHSKTARMLEINLEIQAAAVNIQAKMALNPLSPLLHLLQTLNLAQRWWWQMFQEVQRTKLLRLIRVCNRTKMKEIIQVVVKVKDILQQTTNSRPSWDQVVQVPSHLLNPSNQTTHLQLLLDHQTWLANRVAVMYQLCDLH